ncbi:MAG: glycosyltransferase family 2 protein, partial [Chloroflexota bacterium]
MHLSVIIVSWNVRELLRRCLSSVYASRAVSPGLELEILVVDNASADGTVAMIRSEFPDVRLAVNTGNLGFAAANNRGMHHAKARYIMLLNPDTEVRGDASGRMASYLDEHPGVGMVGPRLLNA